MIKTAHQASLESAKHDRRVIQMRSFNNLMNQAAAQGEYKFTCTFNQISEIADDIIAAGYRITTPAGIIREISWGYDND